MGHTFKVKWATRAQAEEVAKILHESSGAKMRDERLKARFGPEMDRAWLQDQAGNPMNKLDKRDIVYVQEAKDKGLGLVGAAS